LETAQRTVKFFETLLRASTDGIVITDVAQKIILVNKAFCLLLGQRQRDVIETNLFVWLEQLDANGPRLWAELEQRVRLEGECRDVEFRTPRPDGSTSSPRGPAKGPRPDGSTSSPRGAAKGPRPDGSTGSPQGLVEGKYISVNASLLQPVNGEEGGVIVSIWRDVTERVRADETLRESEEKYKGIFETVNTSILMVDKDGYIVDINPHHVADIAKGRAARKDYLGRNVLTHPSIVAAGLPRLYERVLQGETIDKAGVYFPKTTGGTEAYFNVRGAPLLREGQVVGAVFAHEHITELVRAQEALQKAHDELEMRVQERTAELVQANEALRAEIAERVRAEQALRESEQNFRDMAENLLDGVAIADENARHIYVNPKFSEITGYSKDELLNMTGWDLTRPKDRPVLEQRMQNRMAGRPHQRHYERVILRKDGTQVFTEMSTTTTTWHGKKRPMAIVRDLTERMRAEKQIKQALAEKTTLLQELYHRTKNNMQVIYSMLALRSWNVQDEQLLAVLEDVQNKIHSMALVHQKLYESRNLSSIDLKEYVDDLTEYLVQSYQVQSDKISLDLDTKSAFVVIDTAISCGLVLSELISNAFKHAFPGDRTGRISILLRQAQDESITLEVADNGIGGPDDLDLKKSASLGLRTVLGIIEHQLHGELSITTDNGVAWQIRFRDHYRPRV
jgi:PAS domain S-box-containing protein